VSGITRPDGKVVPIPQVNIHIDVNLKTVVDGKLLSPQDAIVHLIIERDYWKDRAGTFEAQLGDLKANEHDAESGSG